MHTRPASVVTRRATTVTSGHVVTPCHTDPQDKDDDDDDDDTRQRRPGATGWGWEGGASTSQPEVRLLWLFSNRH